MSAHRASLIAAALQRRDFATALRHITEAEAEAPLGFDQLMQRALALRLSGRIAAALSAIDAALAIEPSDFTALLSRAALLEQLAGSTQAAPAYRNALQLAPSDQNLPPAMIAAVQHGRALVGADSARLQVFLREHTSALRVRQALAEVERFDEALDIFAGVKRVFHQEPLLLNYPGLPATPFYDRRLFPWLERLEAGADLIRGELHAMLERGFEGFAPYIQFPASAPVNQWGELNHSRRWSSMFLWRDGRRENDACARCPGTTTLLESLPMMRQDAFAPTVTFSALEPHTHIPPHTGSSNTRLLVHLPLILPGPARFRVGNQVREWRTGEAWVFDDTIEHEAWNDADQTRVILIFDIWNPHLSTTERGLVGAMMAAKNQYYSERPNGQT